MRVLILNGSARGSKGITGKMIEAIVSGLSEARARIRRIDLKDISISPCTACLSCMHVDAGVCVIKDDMTAVYDALRDSDLLILAAPVYLDNMPAPMKMAIDRCMCCMKPFLGKDDAGRVRHPYAWRMPDKFLLLSTAGFPEMETFDPIIATFRAQTANFGSHRVGEICIPGSIAAQVDPTILTGHLDLLAEAGRTIATTGSLGEDLLRKLNTSPVTVDQYLAISAKYEDWCTSRLNRCRISTRGFSD